MIESGLPAVRCSGLVHVFRADGTDVAALRGIDLTVGASQRVALLGPSGSGKSTLLSIVAGIIRPSAGRVQVFDTDVAGASERQLGAYRGRNLGLMLQGAATNLILHETAAGNVVWAIQRRRGGRASVGLRVLERGGLAGDRRPVGELTPSEQQIVALAAAMAALPRLLIADEPTSKLDDAARDLLLDLVVETTDAHGTAVLMVTHDEVAAGRMQRVIHMRDGRIGEEGLDRGRFAVVGTDNSIAIPDELSADFPAGALVSIEREGPGALRLRRADPDG